MEHLNHPSSFDPAIHLHSEITEENQGDDASLNHSDDINGLLTLLQEDKAEKNKQGVVIRHRSWKTLEVFRSDDENPVGSTPIKYFGQAPGNTIPSSPPIFAMNTLSSPVAYPTATPSLPRKRRKLEEARSPLHSLSVNVRIGGFLEDDSDGNEGSNLAHKEPSSNPDVPRPSLKSVSSDTSCLLDQPARQQPSSADNHADAGSDLDTSMSGRLEERAPRVAPYISTSSPKLLKINTCSGTSVYIGERRRRAAVSYEQLIAARSLVEDGRARKSFYGIDIHQLQDQVAGESLASIRVAESTFPISVVPSVEQTKVASPGKDHRNLMWTEKYRARKFTDLVGDERTHRSVLRWLKNWDPIVFPGSSRPKPKANKTGDVSEERAHRKILLLVGPPGLGKTTLAHVCARQAGYEVQEINASDERSRDIVRGRIRDMAGTENVRGTHTKTAEGKVRKAGRPVAIVVDEVDGAAGGSGGSGEGGFVKALIDLAALDQKNSIGAVPGVASVAPHRKKKGDKFRILRPLILICNDVYHPSLRPLRQSSIAEIIHIRKPPLNMVVTRMHSIFQKEGIPSDVDGVRRLCEGIWGLSNHKEGGSGNGSGEGDMRSVMVVGEWVAAKLQAMIGQAGLPRLTRRWIEDNILNELGHGGGASRSIGRGGAKEVVERVFKDGAGFAKSVDRFDPRTTFPQGSVDGGAVKGVAEASKRRSMQRLREMIEASGETERIMTDCFTSYVSQPIQDDTFLSKPNAASSWLNFHDALSHQVATSQDWELAPYLSSSILAFHHLFASSATRTFSTNTFGREDDEDEIKLPFSGLSGPYMASETTKANLADMIAFQEALSLPLARMYRSPSEIATELLPYTLRMLSPDVRPVLINPGSSSASGTKGFATASVRKSSEQALVARAAECMAATGVRFEKSRVEAEGKGANSGWVYRMDPPIDSLSSFETLSGGDGENSTRYAVRQVLETEWKKQSIRKGEEIRKARMVGNPQEYEDVGPTRRLVMASDTKVKGAKKDFFGRIIKIKVSNVEESDSGGVWIKKTAKAGRSAGAEEGRVWVSFHEGYSNAVRKPITLRELVDDL